MSVGESARIVGQVLELGYPVLEFSQNERVPVTPDWGVARRAERRARRERAALAAAEGLPSRTTSRTRARTSNTPPYATGWSSSTR